MSLWPSLRQNSKHVSTAMNKNKHSATAEEIFEDILHRTLSGSLALGAKLRAEKNMAEQYGASLSITRKGLALCREAGIVFTNQGDGNYIAGLPSDRSHMLTFPKGTSIPEIHEIRRAIEGVACRHAAARRSPQDLQQLKQTVDALEKEQGRPALDMLSIRAADVAFHSTILNCCQNVALLQLIDVFTPSIAPAWLLWSNMTSDQNTDYYKTQLLSTG